MAVVQIPVVSAVGRILGAAMVMVVIVFIVVCIFAVVVIVVVLPFTGAGKNDCSKGQKEKNGKQYKILHGYSP
jgi:hypothetical protein